MNDARAPAITPGPAHHNPAGSAQVSLTRSGSVLPRSL